MEVWETVISQLGPGAGPGADPLFGEGTMNYNPERGLGAEPQILNMFYSSDEKDSFLSKFDDQNKILHVYVIIMYYIT